MSGLLIDSCNNAVFEGAYDTFEIPDPGLFPPTGGYQTASVVITGDSSDIVFKNMPIGPGAGASEFASVAACTICVLQLARARKQMH